MYVPRAALQSAENKNMSKRTETSKATKKETPKATEGSSPLNGIVEQNDDEGDWDSMFADDGECLNPDMMKELTTAIENVRIVPATSVSTAVQEQENVQGELGHRLFRNIFAAGRNVRINIGTSGYFCIRATGHFYISCS